jgi:hypothetical protein
VYPTSPAERAGLEPYFDFILMSNDVVLVRVVARCCPGLCRCRVATLGACGGSAFVDGQQSIAVKIGSSEIAVT